MVEAMRRGYRDRNAFLGDPTFVANPLERLLSKSYAASLRDQIERGRGPPAVGQSATSIPGSGSPPAAETLPCTCHVGSYATSMLSMSVEFR